MWGWVAGKATGTIVGLSSRGSRDLQGTVACPAPSSARLFFSLGVAPKAA